MSSMLSLNSSLKSLLLIHKDEDSTFFDIISNEELESIKIDTTQKILEMIRNNKNLNIIFIDIELFKLDNLDIIKEIKELDPQIHVIITSKNNKYEQKKESYEKGADDFIIKPFIKEEILSKIAKIYTDRYNIYEQLSLQEQYKSIADESAIISKTDLKGKITYVNKQFEKISGFKQEELIGKPHNIVRHPEMKKETFKNVWKTIQEKNIWRGKVKNKAKDGSTYYVNTVIKPILDLQGNIIEYISIRHNITEIELAKEQLQDEHFQSQSNLQEAIQMSLTYERVINESGIILKLDLDRNIKYANKRFCEISKYTQEEIHGKPYVILQHPDTPHSKTKDMWRTLKSGKTWYGTLRNLTKDKETFYSNVTIIPIKNNKDEIIEYLGVRNDITEQVKLHKELEDTQREIIYRMGEVAETRSKETGNHVKRVAEYSKLLGEKYGLEKDEINTLFMASPMHDIGKVGIPDAILNKPGRFTPEEFEYMKSHSIIGYNILKESNRPILKAAAIISYTHHEKWNGSGYPRGLKGDSIHIFGRITAIADVFDALGSDRVYKKAWELDKILNLFKEERGKHFDPLLVDIFFHNLDDFLKIRDKYKDV